MPEARKNHAYRLLLSPLLPPAPGNHAQRDADALTRQVYRSWKHVDFSGPRRGPGEHLPGLRGRQERPLSFPSSLARHPICIVSSFWRGNFEVAVAAREVASSARRFRKHLAVYQAGPGAAAVAVGEAVVPTRELGVKFSIFV